MFVLVVDLVGCCLLLMLLFSRTSPLVIKGGCLGGVPITSVRGGAFLHLSVISLLRQEG